MSTFNLPDLGEGLQDAEIVAWHVSEGEHVVSDEPLVAVETEKAVVEVPSPQSGYIKRLLRKQGERVKVGEAIIEFDEAPHADAGTVVGDLGTKPAPVPVSPAPVRAAPAQAPAAKPAALARPAAPARPAGISASPAVRALARQRGIELAGIAGTGPNGIITRADLERAGEAAAEKPAISGVALGGIRRSMALNMAKAHAEIVPATVWDEADIGSWWSGHGDITTRLIQAIVAACAAEPILNSWFDGEAMTVQTFDRIDLGLAVDFEGGLIVPVLRDIAGHDAASLRTEVNRLKTAARARSLPVADLRNPTITLSNFGMLAGLQAALVVVPPQVAIIGAGRISQKAVPRDGGIGFTHILPLSLTFDHRVATGGEAGRFLKAMIDELQKKG